MWPTLMCSGFVAGESLFSVCKKQYIVLGCHLILFLCSVCLSQWMALYCHLVASLGTGAKRNHRSGLWIKICSALRLYFARSALHFAHMPWTRPNYMKHVDLEGRTNVSYLDNKPVIKVNCEITKCVRSRAWKYPHSTDVRQPRKQNKAWTDPSFWQEI